MVCFQKVGSGASRTNVREILQNSTSSGMPQQESAGGCWEMGMRDVELGAMREHKLRSCEFRCGQVVLWLSGG